MNSMNCRYRATYDRFGNGSAMRVGPIGFAFATLDDVLAEAKRSAEATHNHPEGIKGAQAIAAAIFLARMGASKEEIKKYVEESFDYDLSRTLNDIRPTYRFDETCQGSVPQAITSFFESVDFESAIRNAVSLGGDSDTLACMAGGIAEAFYGGVPPDIVSRIRSLLPPEFLTIVDEFYERFKPSEIGGARR